MYEKEHPVYPVLQSMGQEITKKIKPKAVVVFSAHWQAKPDLIQLNNAVDTDLIYECVVSTRDILWPLRTNIEHQLLRIS